MSDYAALLVGGKFQGFDNSGEVASYGKLYITDTVGTPVTTYKDGIKAAENTYPIILTASGKADVYLVDGLYNITLADSDDATIWTINNYKNTEAEATVFGKSLIVAADAPAALTILGLSAFFKTLVDNANAYTLRKTLNIPMSNVLTTAKTAAYVVTSSDDGILIPVDATAGNIAITLPAVGDLWNGFVVGFKKIDSSANHIESTPNGAEEIDGGSSHFLRLENSIAWYIVDGTGWKISSNNEVTGDRCVTALKGPAANIAGLRTLGTGALQALPGDTNVSPDYVKVSHVVAYNIDGGTFTAGSMQTRPINTEDSDDSNICSIATNQITLAAGTYRCNIVCPVNRVQKNISQLYNITDSETTILGTTGWTDSDSVHGGSHNSVIAGKFTIAAETVFEIQHQCSNSQTNRGFGDAHDISGINNVYTIAEFWRLP